MATRDQRGDGWDAVLRRQPARNVDGRPEGGYTSLFEIICGECGDDRGMDYSEVPPRLQLIRGPYPLEAGLSAYDSHLRLHAQPAVARRPGR